MEGGLKRSPSPLKILGHRIRESRKNFGWSQEAFADHCGFDRSYIGGVERGERNVTFLTLCQLAKTLNTTVDVLCRNLP
jgi:transcriptional regulator with XRE-family HTH domain